MSCNIKTIKTCEIFSDSIFARSFSFDKALQKVTAKIQKSDSANVQNIELTKISNMFSLEIEPLNLAVGNYKITYIFEILISGKLIRKTGLIENLSILKVGCNCEKSENENLDFSIELNQTVIDVELNFSVLNIGSISESGKSAFDIAVENGFVGTEIEWLLSLKGEKGDKGDTGTAGRDGVDGINGQDGAPGIQGIQGAKGDKGDKGDKGEKGDAFSYADFTPTQIAELQKPATDKVVELDALEVSLNTSESLRVQNENARISSENSRQENENARVTAENERKASLDLKQDRLQDVTGNIGVGKPDASATEKLDVNGNVKATQIKDQYGTLKAQRCITITGNTTLSETHNGAVLNVTNTCNITIPAGLDISFQCVIFAKGSIVVTFVNSGVTIYAPSGLLLKQDKMASLICTSTNNFNLTGELATS